LTRIRQKESEEDLLSVVTLIVSDPRKSVTSAFHSGFPRSIMPHATSQSCHNYGPPILTRREMLARAGAGFGTLALLSLLRDDGVIADEAPHFTPRAKQVIFLFMGGGPSQVDTFDPKPELTKLHGQAVPESIAAEVPRVARARLQNLYASPYKFAKQGKSGIEVSELFPEVGKLADELCILRSCRHDSPIHAPAEYLATTGTQIGDRPSLGSWLAYGLGSSNKNLPAFVVFIQGETGRPPAWSAGFLPARYQGTVVKAGGIPNIALPPGVTEKERRAQLDLLADLDRRHQERLGGDAEIDARIRSYELAFRMQTEAPEAFGLGKETEATKKLYGCDEGETAEFGTQCLLARRLIERGVRFVQLRSGGWDAHGNLKKNHDPAARRTDRSIAALLRDLKERGLLRETLVIWGGEFGRTPAAENPGLTPGRDHSPSGYTMWLAGGGVKGGHVVGATDAVGYAAVERPIHPNDLHATILHALGIDQHRLIYLHHNRKELVTVNGGTVVEEVFA
jgi:hypothetical protein